MPINARWSKNDANSFKVSIDKIFGKPEEVVISAERLDEMNPSMSKALLELINWAKSSFKLEHVVGNMVRDTHDLLVEPLAIFDDCFDVKRHLCELDSVVVRSGPIITIRGYVLGLSKGVLTEEETPYSTARVWLDLSVYRSELDTRYPGWEQRLSMAKELGIEYSDMLTMLFPVNNKDLDSTTSLDDISFD